MPLVALMIGIASLPPFTPAASPEVRPARHDLYGDLLPTGALARLGTIRWTASERIVSIAYSADGKLLAGVCADNQLHIWDYPSGVLLRRYAMPFIEGEQAIAFTVDQKYIVLTGSNVDRPRFIDVASGKMWSTALAPSSQLTANGTVLSANGRWAIGWLSDGMRSRFTHFELASRAAGRDLGLHAIKMQAGIAKVAVSPDGRFCAIGVTDVDNPVVAVGRVFLLDTVNGKIWTSPKFAQNNVIGLSFSADSRSLLVATLNSFTRWEIKSAADAAPETKMAVTYQQAWPGSFIVEAVAVSPDGKYVAGGSSTGLIALWNLTSGKSERTWQVKSFDIFTKLAFSPDSRMLAATTDLDRCVRFFNVPSGAEQSVRKGHSGAVSALAFHPVAKALVSSSIDDGSIRTWDLSVRRTPALPVQGSIVEERISSREHAVLTHPNGPFLDIAFAGNGRLLFAHQTGGSVVVWDTMKGHRPREVVSGFDGSHMAVSPDGAVIAIALPEAGVQLLDARTGNPLSRQPVIPEPVESISFRGDSKIVNFATATGQLVLWDVAAGRERKALPAGDQGVADRYAASPNAAEQLVSIWDRTNGRLVRRLDHVTLPGTLSPDGRYYASAVRQGIGLREIATGQIVLVWSQLASSPRVLSFSPDGNMVAIGYGDGSILLWNARPPRPARTRNPVRVELAKRFDDLGNSDPAVAFAAMGDLASSPVESIAFIREKFKLPRPIDPAIQAQLLADLENPRYAVRETATRRLEAVAGQIEEELEQAMWRSGAEAERRIGRVLESIRQPHMDPEMLRGRRIVELLERLETTESRDLLQKFAKARGAIARDARDALARLRMH